MNNFERLGLCVLLFFITACGTLEITLDHPPTPDAAATGTVGALFTQNAQLATQVAMLNSPAGISTPTLTNLPAATSTSSPVPPPSATRVNFLNGATVGVVSAPISAGQSQSYVLQAFQAQPMYVFVAAPNNDVTVSILGPYGMLVSAADRQISWQGTLKQTGNYYLTVYGGASTENFTLTVTIPLRIQFSQGANSASVSGQTVAGYNVSYAVHASQGQTMSIHLGEPSGQAHLSIYGFTDGQHYLGTNTRQTDYQFVLPATQDYIIVVVPIGDSVVSYTLTVKIQ